MSGRIRLGMVGGGEGAFIGAVHRIASRLDDHYVLVAGALSADPGKAARSGAALGLDPDRCYGDYAAMAQAEAARGDGIEAVSIVTPNHMHAPVADAFLKAGVHVICDKPLTTTLDEARELRAAARESGRLFAVTYNYSGYPLVRHARAFVAAGGIGAVRLVEVEYVQDWLATPLEATGQKQAEWRTDPARSGAGGATGDIGTHAFQLAHFITGLTPRELLADLSRTVPGRRLDDNAHVLMRYEGGARGLLWASQVAVGAENALRIRVVGETGSLDWRQEEPNRLLHAALGEPVRIVTRASPAVLPAGARVTRIPAGHPEGYLEAFATIYADVAIAIRAARTGETAPAEATFPMLEDGFAGVAFVDAAVRSSAAGGVWTPLPAA